MRKVMMIALLASLLLAGLSTAGRTVAGDRVLSLNSGATSTVWFISGEASLVMNAFDLTALGVATPARIDRVSLSVQTPTPGRAVEVVVYGDADGGSPTNARLLVRQTVDITAAGVFTVTFPAPVTVSDRYAWVGFYLPVDFEFLADASGVSSATYWAWQPGSTFDLANIASAGVVGPSNGGAPVNINLNGVARITAEVITGTSNSATTAQPTITATPVQQLIDTSGVSLAPMVAYDTCPAVYYDSGDIGVTYGYGVKFYCRVVSRQLDPVQPEGYRQTGPLYDVYAFGLPTGTTPLPYPVTHCIKPPAENLATAIIGHGFGAPRAWTLLPTVRFGELICAEVFYTGFLSYFTPR